MKKIIITVIFTALLFSFGCSNKPNQQEVNVNAEKTEFVREENQEESDSLESRIEKEKHKYSSPELPSSNIYVNEDCGYEFKLPSDWIGWYFINDDNPKAIDVRFYGKSIRGTVIEKTFSENADFGLTMFFIISEEDASRGIYDNVTFIGTAKGVNYYFATTTDVSLAPIIGEGSFWFDESKKEQELVKNDWEKAKTMMKFYSYENLNSLSNSFVEK